MFTGLVEAVGIVRSLEPRGEGSTLMLETLLAAGLVPGESLAVNGCCLTVTARTADMASFDLLGETLERTNLGGHAGGTRVNLERALRPDGRFGGHFVQGHIDTRAEVLGAQEKGGDLNLRIALPAGGDRYLIEKGSIAVNGVSLTVASLDDDSFGLWIIPHTLKETNLGDLRIGDHVNLEYDMLAKYAEKQLASRRKP